MPHFPCLRSTAVTCDNEYLILSHALIEVLLDGLREKEEGGGLRLDVIYHKKGDNIKLYLSGRFCREVRMTSEYIVNRIT